MKSQDQEYYRLLWKEACDSSAGKLWSREEAAELLLTNVNSINAMEKLFIAQSVKVGELDGFATRSLKDMRLALDLHDQMCSGTEEKSYWLSVKIALPLIIISHMFDWVEDPDALFLIARVTQLLSLQD